MSIHSIDIQKGGENAAGEHMRTAYSYRRLSSKIQLSDGKTGSARQLEAALKYCQEHKLKLDDTLKLTDDGVSAFKGDNISRGALGKFCELVKAGRIRSGSYLLLESLDRLSRANVIDAQELLFSLINRGITVVTLMDMQEYSRESITKNPGVLFLSLGSMIRANDESATKSKRILYARQKRREAAAEGKAFKYYCPPWCEWRNDAFKLIPERASIIKRIFQMYLDGKGPMAIAATLNTDKVPYFGKTGCWYKKIIVTLLVDKRVIGHAHWIEKDGYFPAAISKDLFNRVQARLSDRKRSGGQIGTGPVNILAGLFRCAHCGGTVAKTRCLNRQGYEYFYYVCENARSGKKICWYKSILFDVIENSFLFLMRYRPWFQEMMTDNNGNNIDDVIDALKGERMEAEKQVAKYSGLIEGDDKPSKTLVNKLTEWEAKADQLKERISIAEGKRSELASPEIDEEFFSGLESRMKDNDYRLKVREVLRSMISKITLHVHGVKYPRYVVERNNGNRWTVLFHNATRKNLAFQIFKGDVSKPDEGIIVFDSAALDLAA
jgi:DNA invertase Pin-like site-specific DNA recombinase